MVFGISWKSGEGELGIHHECNSSRKKHIYSSWEKEEHWERQSNPDQSIFFLSFWFCCEVSLKLDFNLSCVQLTAHSDQYSMAHNYELCILMRVVLVDGLIGLYDTLRVHWGVIGCFLESCPWRIAQSSSDTHSISLCVEALVANVRDGRICREKAIIGRNFLLSFAEQYNAEMPTNSKQLVYALIQSRSTSSRLKSSILCHDNICAWADKHH